jgi:glycosyltransferase involved in cell wall biosynthesis
MRILFVEASSGGVVGGSLTGLYHAILGLQPRSHELGMVLYEKKAIEPELERRQVPVFHVSRRRLPKDWSLVSRRISDGASARPRWAATRLAVRRALGTIVEDIPAALRLAQLLRAFQPQVVHAGNGVRANFDVVLACLLARVPVVCHVKGFEKYSPRERWIARRTAGLIFMTRAVEEHCRRHEIVHPHSAVIYDALDEQHFRPVRSSHEVRRELGFDDGALLAGVVGNIQEWKGQAVFVEALARLRDTFPQLRGLLIGGVHRAGSAYYQRIVDEIARRGLEERVRVTGFRTDVADLVNALDVLVHSSVRPEPFGRVILEGMLLSKPVVATAAGGVPELIEHGRTGFLVPPGSPEDLASCLAELLRDSEKRRAVGSAAHRWASQRFRLERHVEELEQFYAKAISRGNL